MTKPSDDLNEGSSGNLARIAVIFATLIALLALSGGYIQLADGGRMRDNSVEGYGARNR